MATYVILGNWTEQGIRNVKDSPGRLDAAKEVHRKHGAELKAFYMTMGNHDMVVISEAPSDEAMAKIALTIGAGGNVRTTTLKAFSEGEYREILQALG